MDRPGSLTPGIVSSVLLGTLTQLLEEHVCEYSRVMSLHILRAKSSELVSAVRATFARSPIQPPRPGETATLVG